MQKANITILFSRRHLCIPFVGLFKKIQQQERCGFNLIKKIKIRNIHYFWFFFLLRNYFYFFDFYLKLKNYD